MEQKSLSELSLEMRVNKSKLAYYSQEGLIKPMLTIGRMKIFDAQKTREIIKKIEKFKIYGKSLKEIKELLNK